MSLGITVVLTSCGRQDLLSQVVKSFEEHASTELIDEFIIVEDGPADNSFVKDLLPSIKNIKLLNSPVPRRGQLLNIEWVYPQVTTPYIFHTEDDWMFTAPNFIEDSYKIMEAHSDCLMVHMSSHRYQWQEEYNISWIDPTEHKIDDLTFWKTRPWIQHDGGFGFSFNPGLRRLSDYYKVAGLRTPIAVRYGPVFDVKDGCLIERTNAENYQRMGMWCASLESAGRAKHIGIGRHIPT